MELTRAKPRGTTPRAILSGQEFAAVHAVIGELKALPGAVIPMFHGIQKRLGYVPGGSVPAIASALNLSVADVHGVLTFYHYFRQQRPGLHVLHICGAEACQALGGRALEEHVKRKLGIDFHATTSDGGLTLEPVYCLGNCALGPAMMVDQTLHGRVTPERFDAICAALRTESVGS